MTLSTFILTLMAACVYMGMGTFLVALQRQFGWDRTTLSGAFSLARAEGAVMGPVEGILVDKIGTRRMVLIGFAIIGVGYLLFSQVQNVWQFYAAFFIISLGGGLGGYLAVTTLVNNWFHRRRGTAMSLAITGIQLGGMLLPVLALGIELHGLRVVCFGIGVFLLATVIPASRFIHNHPEEVGLLPDGDTAELVQAEVERIDALPAEDHDSDFTVREAMKTPAFWALAFARAGSVVSLIALAVHLVPRLVDVGMSLVTANAVVTLYTMIAIPATAASGMIGERFSKVPVIFVLLMMQAFAVLLVALAADIYSVLIFAVIFGIAFGGRVPLMSIIMGDYFGRRYFGTITGMNMMPSNIAMMVTPVVTGYWYDVTGSYRDAFTAFAGLAVLSAIAMLFCPKPKKLRPSTPTISPSSAPQV